MSCPSRGVFDFVVVTEISHSLGFLQESTKLIMCFRINCLVSCFHPVSRPFKGDEQLWPHWGSTLCRTANKRATKAALFTRHLATVTFDKYHAVTLITCECSRMVEIIQSVCHNLHPDGTFFSFWARNCKESKLEERFWWICGGKPTGRAVNTLPKHQTTNRRWNGLKMIKWFGVWAFHFSNMAAHGHHDCSISVLTSAAATAFGRKLQVMLTAIDEWAAAAAGSEQVIFTTS